MSLLSGMTPPNKQTSCKVRSTLQQLEPADAKILEQALADQMTWPAKTLQIALRDRNVIISDISIGRHRKGQCSC